MDILDRLNYHRDALSPRKDDVEGEDTSNLAEDLDGIQIDHGVIKIETVHPIHFYHEIPLQLQINLPILSQGIFNSQIDVEQAVFFDLETTGLAGGTGTYPFLQAYGILNPEGIRIIQYFLSDFGCEIPAYQDMDHEVANKNMLISYNGKSFDYPLLRNRFILNRHRNPFDSYAHLDLLHLARRAWRNQLDGFSMGTIEQKIFLFSRWRDIDGWLIPHAYFEFIREGRTADIGRIITHNQQDIVSLARLLLHLHMIENAYQSAGNSPLELENLCLQAIRKGDISTVEVLTRQFELRQLPTPPGLMVEMSRLYKRQGIWKRAVLLWEELLQSEQYVLFAHEELAKYFEHQQADYERALIHTSKGLEYVQLIKDLGAEQFNPDLENRFLQRLTRLFRRSDRSPYT
jgi:uncharacterized protein YprB with RNaseH-like and TPR domain